MSAITKIATAELDPLSHGPACRRLFEMMDHADTFGKTDEELLPLQLAAAQEYFERRRSQVRILDKRAQDTGIDKIRTFEDIVPLLFSPYDLQDLSRYLCNQGAVESYESVAEHAVGRAASLDFHGRNLS